MHAGRPDCAACFAPAPAARLTRDPCRALKKNKPSITTAAASPGKNTLKGPAYHAKPGRRRTPSILGAHQNAHDGPVVIGAIASWCRAPEGRTLCDRLHCRSLELGLRYPGNEEGPKGVLGYCLLHASCLKLFRRCEGPGPLWHILGCRIAL